MVVEVQVRDGVGFVILNRPERLNAFDKSSWSSLGGAVRNLCGDPGVDAVVITGVGRAFSSGDDIYAMYELRNTGEAEEFFNTLYSAVEAMVDCGKPIVCAVNGLAYGGGMELLLFCDVVIAVEDALFAVPEGRLGLIPPMMITVGLGALGFRLVRRLSITGDPINAVEARELGIVDYVVPRDKLMDKVNEVISSIRRTSPNSIRVIKEWTKPDREALRAAIRELTLMSMTEDARRRMMEFIEERRRRKATQ
ncbi:enoyl-CoA hydratase/isomerase family protein [Vulcanisaeta thermophila]|uniref:enoyl-CoA hydratase/isomerase family protein n=1 Tax=Vulcanisaeta thermophila TaxID=867917 RepID=UPI000852B16F|nr:enoyl-CoA hydratase/isomerase family protein [Vulcanisaeta thermophila]